MIVVIGATSFIGVYTVDALLRRRYDVVGTGNTNTKAASYLRNLGVTYVKLDLNNDEYLSRLPSKDVSAVVLLAGLLPANSGVDLGKDENAAEYIRTNTIGTARVLEYCRKNGISKLVTTTTYADVFGSWKRDEALTESEPRNHPFSGDHAAYVISKNAATDLVHYYNQQHGMSGCIFRLPPVYGVGPHDVIYDSGKQKKSGIAIFIEKALSGEPIEIHGDPGTSRDIVYVKDVAKAILQTIESSTARGLYNITSGVGLTLEKQVRTVIEVFSKDGVSSIVYRPEIPNTTPSYLFDISKARRDFGYNPEYSDYEKMMRDYKHELESGRFSFLTESRRVK